MGYKYISGDTVDLIKDMFLEGIPKRKIEFSISSMDLKVDFDSVSVNEDWYSEDVQKFKYYFMDDEDKSVLRIKNRYYKFFIHISYKSGEISKIFLGTDPIRFGSDYFCQIPINQCIEDNDYIYILKKVSKLSGDGAISRLNKGAENTAEKFKRRQRLIEILNADTLMFNTDEWIVISKINKRKFKNRDNWNDIYTQVIFEIIRYAIYVEYILVEKHIQEKNQLRFFIDSDFDAFDEKFATSEDEKIIGKRQYVIDNRFKYLHFDERSGQGLVDFFKKHNLHPHWQKTHLTNVIWPFPIANGGYVDYVRMGYGKDALLVKELAKRTGVFTEITDQGVRDAIAFFCVTQLQVGLNQCGWWVNLYIDKKGWIEEYNLLEKINSSVKLRKEFIDLLIDINKEGYKFYITVHPYENINYDEDDAEDFINILEKLKIAKKSFSISIEKFYEKDAIENNHDMLKYLKGEFTKLLPLYNFISWHPQKNNYLGI